MRTKDELGRAHTLISQERDRAQASEQRAKHLQEELKCQRQNAETSRCNAEQKRKEIEREHQRELLELQKERQALERQHQQESHKLNQEIQQARTLHHTLQSQHDKLGLQKQAVEQELDFIKGKLKGTESELQDTQKREAQTQAKLTEALRDSESLTVTIEQLKRKERSLEEEVKRLSEELADALRRLKELQDQPPAPAAVITPPQYSSCGDSFNPVVSYDRPSPHQTQTHKKKALKVDRTKEEAIQRAKYPSDREPGEGIDSEQIKEFGSEQPAKGKRKEGRREKVGRRDEESDQTDEAGEVLSSALEEDASSDEGGTNQLCPKSQLTETLSSSSSPECSRSKPTIPSPSQSPNRGGGQTDLKRENVALRDELRDTKQELERRLDDLESQRRAEAEARTKLKQLSRKHSTQTEQLHHRAQEQQEERQRLERQLEEARRETGRLEEALAAAEGRLEESRKVRDAEAAGERGECERLREALTEMERKGREMEEESGRLKEDLEVLRVELTQEREDREKGREEEEEEGKEEGPGKEDLLAKVSELEAELDELRKAPKENLQLKYLQLNGSCDDNKAMVFNDEDIIPSPIDHVSFCQAVNLQNSMVSQEASTKNFITDLGACKKLAEHSRNENEARSAGLAQEVERLKVQCESLRAERDRESGRSKTAQNRLEVLQKQVTSQTQQLTRAFESQSSHIEGLLLELQHRDAAIQRQGEELRLCQEEMAQVRAAKEKLETEVRTDVPQIDSSDDAKEVSVHSDATVDKTQPEARCDMIDNTKAKTLDKEADVVSVKEVLNTSTPVEPQAGEQHKAVAQSNTSNVPFQTVQTNAQDASTTDVQAGSLPCEIAASGNTVAIVERSGNFNEKQFVHTETTVQEGSGEAPLDTADPRLGRPAAALASGQLEHNSHNSTLLQSPADVQALDASTMTEAAEGSPESQREMDLLRAQNAQLTQALEEASVEELRSVRVENEQLKSRLKQLEAASVHAQDDGPAGREDDGALRPCREGQGDLSVQTSDADNTEERVPPVQPVSVQPDATTVTETTVERSTEKESLGKETFGHSDTTSHEQQLQALLSELRRLTGENESQAEELELWRTAASGEPSALLPGATAGRHGDGGSILVVREDHILLPCSTDKLGGQLLETRSMIHHHQSEEAGGHPSTTTTQRQQDSPVPPKVEVDHGASVKSSESEDGELTDEVSSCHEVETMTKGSQRRAEDLHSETPSTDRRGSNTKEKLCDSPTKTKTVLGQTDQVHQRAGPGAPGPDAKANSVSCTSNQAHSSTEASEDAARQTKADDSGPEAAHGQTLLRESVSAPACQAELGVGSVSVTPSGTSRSAETHQYCADAAEEKLRPPEASRDGAEGQSSEVTGLERAQVSREVKSAATQTEETHAQSPENTPQRAAVLDASTQTDRGPTEEEEDEVTDSPCPSPGAAAESEKLLLSSSFPIPANPAHLAERIRRNRNRMSAAYDDTEYEPYGLPEVVMKGFADIPSGPACPYVLRRGLLGTPAVALPAREVEGDTDP
ncbi:centromere protein F-like [Alosa sapidissima]|uniref:centromere protein F-like n=1 Tax=Alosa sapidissima TaxID=34773 RepID=UPI001C094DA5|nr:centromere protein F-like [Alosa sapidissima]